MPDQPDDTWSRVRYELRRAVPDSSFHIWLDPLELAGAEGRHLYVRAPDHIRSWVRDRYVPLIRDAAARALPQPATVEVVDTAWAAPQERPHGARPRRGEEPALNPKYTFEQFVFGGGSRLAHCAALAVAEQPGQAYNPLFIHGRPGLGKTHLLHAIGHFVRRFGSGLTVRYSTGEDFTTEFVGAVKRHDTAAFKERFRGVDVLLLDDVQYLVDKTRTEEELFHTFNALRDSGRQLVMTCDRSPAELAGLEERLRDRFACGLVVGVEAPELSVRRAILEKRLRLDGVTPDASLIEEIAVRVTTSVRALEAALIQLVASASLRGESPSAGLARRLLPRVAAERQTTVCTPTAIVQETADHFTLQAAAILARDRRPAVATARKVAMYLTRELTGESYPEIGRSFGGRDHSTVLSAVRSVASEMETNSELAHAVHSVRLRLSRDA